MTDAQALRCPSCAERMTRVEQQAHPGSTVQIEFYQCGNPNCQRKAALWWELTGKGLTQEQMTFVEREVSRRGAFFPSDYR